MSNRENNLAQIEQERAELETISLEERGTDEVLSAPNPGVIVIPKDRAYKFPQGLSGSLTKLVTGEDYLIAGSNVTLMTGANGSVTISAVVSNVSAGGSVGEVQFHGENHALTGSSGFFYNPNSNSLTVTNISGSLTKLSGGDDYLIAGAGIDLLTGSNGSITISVKQGAGESVVWGTYTPAINGTISAPTLPPGNNLYGKFITQDKALTLIFSLSGETQGGSAGNDIYTISMPPGKTIDTSVVSLGTDNQKYLDGTSLGVACLTSGQTGAGGAWSVIPVSSTTVILVGQNPNSSTQPLYWGSTSFPMNSLTNYRISFVASIPIV